MVLATLIFACLPHCEALHHSEAGNSTDVHSESGHDDHEAHAGHNH